MKPSLHIDNTAPRRIGHHPEPVDGAGFGEDGERIATSDFVYPSDGQEREPGRDEFAEKLGAFLSWLTEGGTVEAAGRKALLLAHLCGKADAKSDREFAKRVGVTPARVSQLRREITNGYKRLGRLNSRAT